MKTITRSCISIPLFAAALAGISPMLASADTISLGQTKSGGLNQYQYQGFLPAPTPSITTLPTSLPTVLPSVLPSASPIPAAVTIRSNVAGTFLTDGLGKSLYVFSLDTNGNSNCTGNCSQVWPPVTVAAGQTPNAGANVQASLLGTITLADGSTQVTYNSLPLYYYTGDASPGQSNGEGLNQFGGLWYVIAPDGTPLTSLPSPSPSPSTSPSATPSSTPTTAPTPGTIYGR
ncbi:MAG: hypothetical protein P4M08_07145 [Oligoflexia bacterium]|nr:hypothetical protein [Oligoflexia bacterium]